MKGPVFFDSIVVTLDRERIYQRLGYKKNTTLLGEGQERVVNHHVSEAFALIDLKGSAAILDIKKRDNGKVFLENGVVFASLNLTEMLKGSNQVLLMGTTVGRRIMPYIRGDSSRDNLSQAIIHDATASEVVDSALDWIVSYFNQNLTRENKRVTPNRFSCGYGDFLLANQKKIYEVLNLKKIGVKITGSCILDPEKSVTAVAGIVNAVS